jgi:hypothetical protein
VLRLSTSKETEKAPFKGSFRPSKKKGSYNESAQSYQKLQKNGYFTIPKGGRL